MTLTKSIFKNSWKIKEIRPLLFSVLLIDLILVAVLLHTYFPFFIMGDFLLTSTFFTLLCSVAFIIVYMAVLRVEGTWSYFIYSVLSDADMYDD